MSIEERLPDELLWRQDGHLSDEAAVAVADGQNDILPSAVLSHADGCEACGERIAQLAMHSVELQDWFAQSPAHAAGAYAAASYTAASYGIESAAAEAAPIEVLPPRRPQPSPRWAIAAALLLALLGLVPSLGLTASRLGHYQRVAEQLMPALIKSGVALFQAAREPLGLMSFLPALLLCIAGIVIARRASRNQLSNGEAHV